MHKLLQDFKSKMLAMINKDKPRTSSYLQNYRSI